MKSRTGFSEWAERQVHGIGSLASAIVLVVGVLLFALVSLGVASGALPAAPGASDTRMAGAEDVFEAAQVNLPALYIKAIADRPVALTAEIETYGWKDRGRRIIDAQIAKVEPSSALTAVGKLPRAYPEGQITDQLRGRRVLASVAEAAALALPESGAARVALIVTPAGETATLVIEQVLSPAKLAASGAQMARSASVGSPATATPQSQNATAAAGPAARVTSLSRYWGAPGTLVTMYGTGFGGAAGASWVTCAGAKAKVKSWSNTRIEFWVPSTMTKQGYVGVNKNKVNSNGMFFSPSNPPVITSITPREGAPGTIVTLTGKYFGSKQVDGWVSFASSTAQVVSWTDAAIRVVVPKDATSGYVGVVAHGMTSNGVLYGPLGAPLVQSVSAKVLIPGRTVSIKGRSFGVRKGVVVVAGSTVASTYWSAAEVRFTVPTTAKAGYVGIVRADSMTSNGVWMPNVPRVDSLSRWWASPDGEITVSGVGFGTTQDVRSVFIGGKEMAATSWSDTAVTVQVPATAASGYVGVGTRSACSNGIWLVVETRAHVDDVSPRLVAPGDRITVTGSDFGPAPSGSNPTSKVAIGGLTCAVERWSDDTIVAVVPDGIRLSYLGVVKQGVASNGKWIVPKSGD